MELPSATDAMSAAGEGRTQDEITAQATWRKSSYSTYNGNCVEVAQLTSGFIGVRDTKNNGSGLVLVFPSAAWRKFLYSVKDDLVLRS